MHHLTDEQRDGWETNQGIAKLLELLPDTAGDFTGSQYSQPAAWAYYGGPAEMDRLRGKAESLLDAGPAALCETAMVMAETIEAACPDKADYFLTDAKVRSTVFTGSKWRAGWVFIMGSADHKETAAKFKEENFLVFCQNGAGLEGVRDLGPRETAAVYFLQLMVRYAMIWGRIEPGNDHEMGHFLEVDMPGVVVAKGELTPVEELLLLALMKMGAPAVVPQNYPFEQGRQVRAEGTEDIIKAATMFPNLRIKIIGDERITLPDFCEPHNAREDFEPDFTIGYKQGLFLLKPDDVDSGLATPEMDDLAGCESLAVIIRIGDKRLDVSTSLYLENRALECINMISGLRAIRDNGAFSIEAAKGTEAGARQIVTAVAEGLKFHFPLLENINVRLVTDQEDIDSLTTEYDAFIIERENTIAAESDDNVEFFHHCLECQPFSSGHVCVVSPDRPPMCGRDRFQVKAAALFGATWHPYKRRDISDEAIRGVIPVNDLINKETGEYGSVNETIKILSGGQIERVELYSIRNFPHSNCGCFQFLAFWMDEGPENEAGIGVMERSYKGTAPGGITWNTLANNAGGKQFPGVMGVSGEYLRSKRFLSGDGGHTSVRWLSPRAYEIMKDLLPNPEILLLGD